MCYETQNLKRLYYHKNHFSGIVSLLFRQKKQIALPEMVYCKAQRVELCDKSHFDLWKTILIFFWFLAWQTVTSYLKGEGFQRFYSLQPTFLTALSEVGHSISLNRALMMAPNRFTQSVYTASSSLMLSPAQQKSSPAGYWLYCPDFVFHLIC